MNEEVSRRARICLLYHSGTGGTKLVADLVGELLSPIHDVSVLGIEDNRAARLLAESDFLVLFYPTYFLRPSPSMREFIASLGPFDVPRYSYLVTTYEFYTENSIRACALMLRDRGIGLVGSKAIRAPGSDLTCLFPSWLLRWLYRFEKGLPRKLHSIAAEVAAAAIDADRHSFIPAVKWYSPFAQLLQVSLLDRFANWRHRIRVLPGRCDLCGACVGSCDRAAWELRGKDLRHLPERCELCTRCIHRCPKKAIVLIEGLKDNARLDPRLFARLRAEARGKLLEEEACRAPRAQADGPSHGKV